MSFPVYSPLTLLANIHASPSRPILIPHSQRRNPAFSYLSSSPVAPLSTTSPSTTPVPPTSSSSADTSSSPPSSSQSLKRKRPDHDLTEYKARKMAVKNEVDIVTFGDKHLVCVIPRSCGHKVHPAHKYYQFDGCPLCNTQEYIKVLRHFQLRFKERGGILDSKEKSHEEHSTLLRGQKTKGRKKKAVKLNQGPEIGSWRGAKKTLVNHVQQLKEMTEMEQAWAEDRMLEFQEDAMPEWMQYSASISLQYYRKFEEGILYVDGDPAAKKCEPGNYQGEPIVKKRRLAERSQKLSVSFNETVVVSAPHDIDECQVLSPSPPKQNYLWSKLMPQPKSQSSTKPLIDKDYRPKPRFCRSKSKYYRPGTWSSPERYEKADTSWCTINMKNDKKINRLFNQLEEEQRIMDEETARSKPSVNGAIAVIGGVGGAVFALKSYFNL